MNNLCFNRFTLRTDDAKTRRKILRWLALNYRLYECLPSEAEIRGRFISVSYTHLTLPTICSV